MASPIPPDEVPRSFDPNFYLKSNPDVDQALQTDPFWKGKTALDHFMQYGRQEGRQINAGSTPQPPAPQPPVMPQTPVSPGDGMPGWAQSMQELIKTLMGQIGQQRPTATPQITPPYAPGVGERGPVQGLASTLASRSLRGRRGPANKPMRYY